MHWMPSRTRAERSAPGPRARRARRPPLERLVVPALLALPIALAGCIGDDGMSDDETIGAVTVRDDVFLVAEGATFSGNFVFSFHGAPVEGHLLPLCQPPTGQCHYYDVPITAKDAAGNVLEDVETRSTLRLEAMLTWGSPATALDLYLLRDGTEVAQSASWSLGTDLQPHVQQLSVEVGPGDYQLMVVGYHAAMDAYDLDVTFER